MSDVYYFYVISQQGQWIFMQLDATNTYNIILSEIPHLTKLNLFTSNNSRCLYRNILVNSIIKQILVYCLEDEEIILDIQYYGRENLIVEGEKNIFAFETFIIQNKQPKSNIYLLEKQQFQESRILDLSETFSNIQNQIKFNQNKLISDGYYMMGYTDQSEVNNQKVQYLYKLNTNNQIFFELYINSTSTLSIYAAFAINSLIVYSIDDEVGDNKYEQFMTYQSYLNNLGSGGINVQLIITTIMISSIFTFFTLVFIFLTIRRIKERKLLKTEIEYLLFSQNLSMTKQQFDQKYDLDYKDSIGSGSFGVVYKVKNKHKLIIKNPEILKNMPDSYACKQIIIDLEKREQKEIIENEIQVLQRLKKYKNVIQLQNFMVGVTLSLIVFDLADSTLQNLINQRQMNYQKFSELEIVIFLIQIGKTLANIYLEENIAHRDIKPSNILIKNDNYFLSDFGCAKEIFQSENLRQNMVLGTIKWMSPEVQAGDTTVDVDFFKSDVFSLGMILLYMLSLNDISQVNSDEQNKKQKLRVMQHLRNNDTDKNILLLVNKMLETNPDKRPDASIFLTTIMQLEQQFFGQQSYIENQLDGENKEQQNESINKILE